MANIATVSSSSLQSVIDHKDTTTTASYSCESDDNSFQDADLSIAADTKTLSQSTIDNPPNAITTPVNNHQNEKIDIDPLTVDDESTCTSSSVSSYESESRFEKPARTYSEDTTVTTPEMTLNKETAIATSARKQELENNCQEKAHSYTPVEDLSPNVTKRSTMDQLSITYAVRDLQDREVCESIPATKTEEEDEKEIEIDHLQDISLEEEVLSSSVGRNNDTTSENLTTAAPTKKQETITNHLREITSALVSGKKPNISVLAPVPTRSTTTHTATTELPDNRQRVKNRSDSVLSSNSVHTIPDDMDSQSVASSGASTVSSTATNRSLFNFWSPFRSSSSSSISITTTSPASSRRPSKQASVLLTNTEKADRPASIISPLPGFQEALLEQMEQLNVANTNDPKSKVLRNMKRQSIRHSLVAQNKGDDYDWDFWAGFMCDYYQNFSKLNKEIAKHIKFGIPPSIRGMVWQLLAKSKDEVLVADYIHLLKKTSPYDKMIQRDLARTFPGHLYFKDAEGQGQEGLYNVVRAYSLYDTEVGYCQGLAFIVGPLLLNMPDEDAFCVLIQLMKKYGLRGHFTPEMEGLQLRLYQFDVLMQDHLPHIARHLKQQGINSTMYASQWFMTLFAYKFPLNLVFRIYDVIFTEGISSIFKFALALLKRNQTTILGLDFEQLLIFLKDGLFEEYKADDKLFVSDACELEIPLKKLSQLAREYKLQLKKEQADANALEELQKSNLKLKKQFKELKTKTDETKREKEDVDFQLQETIEELRSLQEEQASLVMLVSSLKGAVDTLPRKIEEATSRGEFEKLCSENAELTSKNSILEDQLQKAEATLIDIKMRYAESENEREELHKRLYELKKIMSF